jgi:lipopolysaccharide exporter
MGDRSRLGRSNVRLGALSKAVAGLTVSKAVTQALAIALLPLITQFYPPSVYGAAMAVLAVARIAGPVLGGAYQLAVPIVPSERHVWIVVRLVIGSTVTAAGVLSIAMIVIDITIPSVTFTTAALVGIPMIAILNALFSLLTQVRIRQRAYGLLSVATLAQGTALTFTLVALGILFGTRSAIIASHAFGFAAALIVLGRKLPWRAVLAASTWNLRRIYVLARRYRRFPSLTLPTVLLNALTVNSAVLAFASLLGTTAAGLYALGERLALAPVTLLGASLASVYVGEMSSAVRESPRRIVSVYRTALASSGVLAILTFLVVALLGPPVTVALLPSSWGDVASLLTPFALMSAWRLMATAVARVFVVLERQAVALYWNVAKLVATLSSIILASALGLDLRATIWFYAVTTSSLDLIIVVLAGRVTAQESRRRVAESLPHEYR